MRRTRSHGFTLIEMMISVAIGMVIVLGLTTLYLSSQKTARMRDAIGGMEANARIALAGIRQSVQHAGYPSIYNVPLEKPFHSASDGDIDLSQTCRGGSEKLIKPNSIKKKYSKDSNGRDWLVVKYRADNENSADAEIIRDCVGGIVDPACSADPDNGMYDSMEAIVYNALYINGNNSLLCAGSRSPVPQPIAENVTNMQFLYGVNSRDGMQYLSADVVESQEQWESVTSVQVAILVQSDDEVLSATETRSFVLLDMSVEKKDDRHLYRVYSTTINLPNRNRRVL